jgi:Uma2 family endonuclease
MLIADWLVGVFSKLNVREQLPIRVPGEAGRFTEPEPDLAVTIEPTTAYAARHPGPDDLVLAVEVADSSLEFDLTTKALLYARAGIRGYWVADIASRQVHVHRNPAEDGYRSIERLVCGESVSLAARPEATVDIDTFFPSAIAGPSEAPII